MTSTPASNSVNQRHPLYSDRVTDWEQQRDTYKGERAVKAKGFVYLPPTSGMVADGALKNMGSAENRGAEAYRAYRLRARVPDYHRDAVEAALGVMHHKPPTIELPEQMERMRENASLRGDSLEMLLRRINQEQLITGRCGLLADVPTGPPNPDALPYLVLYEAEKLINWDEGEFDSVRPESLNLVVIDESEDERIGTFDWERVEKYRVLILGDAEENEQLGEQATYRVGVVKFESGTVRDTDNADGTSNREVFDEDSLIEPEWNGSTHDAIPFAFINSKDIVPDPDEGPLLGLSNLVLTIYRGDADHRQALFLQGQDTLVVIGGSAKGDLRTGAGARIDLPAAPGADAKYIGVGSEGLSEMRESLEDDRSEARERSRGIFEQSSRSGGGSAESGEALRIRVASRTASLNQIALVGAFGLQSVLRSVARWIGANPEEVIVTPNTDFVDDDLTGSELGDLIAAKNQGAPIALETIHEHIVERGLSGLSWDEEKERMQAERDEELPGASPIGFGENLPGTNPEGPAPDEEAEDDELEADDDDDSEPAE